MYQKIKRILNFYPENEFFICLYKYSKKEFKNQKSLLNFKTLNYKKMDTLIIGNTYKYLSLNNIDVENNYYFQLLTNQYLFFNFMAN